MIRYLKSTNELKVDQPEYTLIHSSADNLGLDERQAELYYRIACIYTYCNAYGVYDLVYYNIVKACCNINGYGTKHYLAVTKINGDTILKQCLDGDKPYYKHIYSVLKMFPEVKKKTPNCKTYKFSVNDPRLLEVLNKAYSVYKAKSEPKQVDIVDETYVIPEPVPEPVPAPVVPDTPTMVSEPLTNDKVLIPDCILNLYKYYAAINTNKLEIIHSVINTILKCRAGGCDDAAQALMDISNGR